MLANMAKETDGLLIASKLAGYLIFYHRQMIEFLFENPTNVYMPFLKRRQGVDIILIITRNFLAIAVDYVFVFTRHYLSCFGNCIKKL